MQLARWFPLDSQCRILEFETMKNRFCMIKVQKTSVQYIFCKNVSKSRVQLFVYILSCFMLISAICLHSFKPISAVCLQFIHLIKHILYSWNLLTSIFCKCTKKAIFKKSFSQRIKGWKMWLESFTLMKKRIKNVSL